MTETLQEKCKKLKRKPEYKLFAEAMGEFSKMANLALEALKPFANHTGNCSTSCPSCRLKSYYKKVKDRITEI